MSIEHELKLTGGVDLEVPDPSLVAGVTAGAAEAVRLSAIYYDTPSLALARAGLTLRVRTGEQRPSWTLKVPAGAAARGLARHEFEIDEPVGPIPDVLRRAVGPYVLSQSLGPVVRMESQRRQTQLTIGGKAAATLVDDHVVADDGGSGNEIVFRELEVELVDGTPPRRVHGVVAALRRAGFDADDARPKALRVLGERAEAPPDVVAGPVDADTAAAGVVQSAIARSVAQMLRHHPGLVISQGEEDVHQFRVASRRLRSDLRTFASILERGWVTWLRDELKWLGGEVGVVRDADVLSRRLRGQISALPAEDRVHGDRLVARVDAERAKSRERMVDALGSERCDRLFAALVDAARLPRLAIEFDGEAYQPAARMACTAVRHQWRRLEEAADALTIDSPDAAFHAVRIKAKRARYASEAVVGVFGADARRFAKAVEKVQSILGEHQDTAVAEAWLRAAASAVPSARLVIGELITVERLERVARRKDFAPAWRRLKKPKLRAWFD
jgi:CHAD domain-containing protein